MAGCTSKVYDTPTETNHSLPTVEWLPSSLHQIDAQNAATGYYSYPRMVQLSSQSLMIVFENNGNIYTMRSIDFGNSWLEKKLIAEKRNNINATVPEIIKLKNGNLIIAYNLRPAKNDSGYYDSNKKFAIAVRRSSNNGENWSSEEILYEAGSEFENGCWEPAIVQISDDTLYLLFANEGIYINSTEQNISLLKSLNQGKSWSRIPEIISFAKGARDGMPVPFINNKRQLVFGIEDNSDGGEFKPSIIMVDLPWSGAYISKTSSSRKNVLRKELQKNVYAGAPYIRQLATGEYLLSFQSTLHRKDNWALSSMQLVVFDDKLKSYHFLPEPFTIPINRSALWNSFLIADDNKTIITLSATNAFTSNNTIWIKKGIIKK